MTALPPPNDGPVSARLPGPALERMRENPFVQRLRLGSPLLAVRFTLGQLRLALSSGTVSTREALSYLRLRGAFEFGIGRRGAGTIKLHDRMLVVGTESSQQDLDTFVEVFVKDTYADLDVRGAEVLDLGAHKGYFAAWALRHGAAHVVSFEPHPENFAALEEALGDDNRWEGVQAAVGAETRQAALHVSDSWSHSLEGISAPNDVEVDVCAFEDVVERLRPRGRRVAKIDIEGTEQVLSRESDPEVLAQFDEIAMEIHGPPEAVRQHFASAGFREEIAREDGVFLFRR